MGITLLAMFTFLINYIPLIRDFLFTLKTNKNTQNGLITNSKLKKI